MSFLTQSHQVFFGHPLCLIPSTSHVIQCLTQSSSFCSTCPNHLNLLLRWFRHVERKDLLISRDNQIFLSKCTIFYFHYFEIVGRLVGCQVIRPVKNVTPVIPKVSKAESFSVRASLTHSGQINKICACVLCVVVHSDMCIIHLPCNLCFWRHNAR